jgi:hypothetical protein
MKKIKSERTDRPNIWKVICDIDDGLLPFICGATISAGLSTMLDPSFKWERFFTGFSLFLVSAFVFSWYVCLKKIKKNILENEAADKARILSDSKIWAKYYTPRKVKMCLLFFFAVFFIILSGVFLFLSYFNSYNNSILNLCR